MNSIIKKRFLLFILLVVYFVIAYAVLNYYGINCVFLDKFGIPCPGCGMTRALVAVLLAFFLGSIGIHDFYLGYNKNGIIKIVLTVCTGVGGSIWALIDFIRLLTGSLNVDANGVELKKEF